MEEIKYTGKIIEVIQYKRGNQIFEVARRSPGVRALIVKKDKILLSKEFRNETQNYDLRLPGGKVFDTLEEYKSCDRNEMLKFAKMAVLKEIKEEVGLKAKNPNLIKVSKCGATMEWDLYYFLITDFSVNECGQQLEEGEDISFDWYCFDEVKQLCASQKIQEDRSVGVLLSYIEKTNNLTKNNKK